MANSSYTPPSLTTPTARRLSSGGAPTAQNLGKNYTAPNNRTGVVGPSSMGADTVSLFQDNLKNRIQKSQSNTNAFLNQIEQQKQAKLSKFQQQYGLQKAGEAPAAAGPSGPMPDFGNTSGTDLRNKIVKTAASRLGTPYAWGGGGYGVFASRGTGKGTQGVVGVDCSGLTSWVYSQYGIRLPRQSDAQLRTMGHKTSVANARPGDLIGWNKGGHVAIYAGNGWLIESPKPGGKVQYRRVPSGTFAVRLNLPGD